MTLPPCKELLQLYLILFKTANHPQLNWEFVNEVMVTGVIIVAMRNALLFSIG